MTIQIRNHNDCPEEPWVPENTHNRRALARYDQWKAIVFRHNQMAEAANTGNLWYAADMMQHAAGHYRAVLDHSPEHYLAVPKQKMRTLMTESYNALRKCLHEHNISGVMNSSLNHSDKQSGTHLQEMAGELKHLCHKERLRY